MPSRRLCFVSADGERTTTLEADDDATIADLLEAVLIELQEDPALDDAPQRCEARYQGEVLPPTSTVRELNLLSTELIHVRPRTAGDSGRKSTGGQVFTGTAVARETTPVAFGPTSTATTTARAPTEATWPLSLHEDDLMDPTVQRRIEAAIQQRNIQENLEAALEHNVEAFISITPLYVRVLVTADWVRNAQPVVALVDSGAQRTVMSLACAERCGLSRLIDRRFHGTAIGLGQTRVVGRVHMALMEIDGEWFECSFTIVESQTLDLLLGLDMLRKHGMCIDLRANLLRVREHAVCFLTERQVAEQQGQTKPPIDADLEAKVQR
ncbi:hypothetical protein CCYA_CCYA02G0526 [Cyanidiococcus yangmingshanensis]|nr:hypothetical protein CCYA_CCYA02G0526 [Cyanidiococcus yangmingshanensis]